MKTTGTAFRRIAAWAGILAPVLFVGIFTLEGMLRPGYDPQTMYISALSLGPRGWIQIANFLVLGALLFVFARGVAAEIPTGKASRWGPILLTVLAILFFVSGPFVMDPADTPTGQMTVPGTIHGLAGGLVFVVMPITIFIYLRRFLADPDWNWMKWWTLGLGVVEAAAVLFFSVVGKIPLDRNPLADWLGLIQRAALVPFMFWLFLFALGMLMRGRRN